MVTNLSPLKVAVFGANGATGQRIVTTLLACGQVVIACARRPETMDGKGVTVRKIDFSDPSSTTNAIIGCDAVISAVGSRSSTSTSVYSVSARAIRAGMRACGIRRLVVLSCEGVEEGFEVPRVLANLRRRIGMNRYLDIVRMETILEETMDLDWTVVRLTNLVDVKSRPYMVENRVLEKGSLKISYNDVADFIAKELVLNKWIRMFPVLGYSWSSF